MSGLQNIDPYDLLNKRNNKNDDFIYEKKFGLETYWELVNFKGDVSSNKKFQRNFVSLYKDRNAKQWRERFFTIFQDYRKKISHGEKMPPFEDVLCKISPKAENKVHPSNASKMLNLLDSSKPLIDKNIRNAMKSYANILLKQPRGSFEDKKRIAIQNYKILESFYSEFTQTAKAEEFIACYDHFCPNYKNIDPIKKIDFVLWEMGSVDPKQAKESD